MLRFKRVLIQRTSDSDEMEQARKDWLPRFLQSSGFEKLLKLLNKLTDTIINQKKDSRVIKFCLKEVMDSIRILLVS